MSNFDILKNLMDAQKDTGTQAYDTTATVRRIEGSTAWVHIPGGVDETPVRLTISAKAGDTVQVRVGGGSAWLVGNQSAPPTDDTTAEVAQTTAETAHVIATKANTVATSAKKIADNTNQYFWMVSEGDDTGAHITEVTQEEFLADPDNGGGNLLARSNGIAIRDGLTELATFSSGGLDVTTYDTDNNDVEIAHLGYGEGNAQSGTATAPYYTLGVRLSGSTVGNYSMAEGYDVTSNQYASHAEGWETTAGGYASHAEGWSTTASGHESHAEGYKTTSSGSGSHAEGYVSTDGAIIASGIGSHAEGFAQGYSITASAFGAHAEGSALYNDVTASGRGSHAEGSGTTASGSGSHAEGNKTVASGSNSHAEGMETTASGAHSHAGGYFTTASSDFQTAIGKCNVEDTADTYALIIGNGNPSVSSNALTVDWDGNVQAAGQVKSTTETYSLTLPSAVYFGGGLVRNGGVAMLSIINISKLPRGQTTLCTLPEGWRPPISVMRKFEAPDSSAGPVRLFINSSGVVSLYNYGAAITAASNISDTITYVLA